MEYVASQLRERLTWIIPLIQLVEGFDWPTSFNFIPDESRFGVEIC
jgi:hypothetical protein